MTDVRQAIATAASAVEGVSCSPSFKQTTKPGDAMVRMTRLARDESGFGFMTTWQVWLVAPQDVAKAEAYIDEKIPVLIEALRPELIVTTATPGVLVIGDSNVNGVVFEGVRETD